MFRVVPVMILVEIGSHARENLRTCCWIEAVGCRMLGTVHGALEGEVHSDKDYSRKVPVDKDCSRKVPVVRQLEAHPVPSMEVEKTTEDRGASPLVVRHQDPGDLSSVEDGLLNRNLHSLHGLGGLHVGGTSNRAGVDRKIRAKSAEEDGLGDT